MAAVLGYLDDSRSRGGARAPASATRASITSAGTPQPTARAGSLGLDEPCESEVVAQLVELQPPRGAHAARDGSSAEDECFHAEQNARVVRNAEQYYRTMFAGRDGVVEPARHAHGRHARRSLAHLDRTASAAEDRRVGAQLARRRRARDRDGRARRDQRSASSCASVTAARSRWSASPPITAPSPRAHDWDEPAERKRVRPALAGQLGGAVPWRRAPAVPADWPRRCARPWAHEPTTAARDRGHLSPRDRAPQPLLSRAARRTVRRDRPHRRDPRGRSARDCDDHPTAGCRGGAARDLPERDLSGHEPPVICIRAT